LVQLSQTVVPFQRVHGVQKKTHFSLPLYSGIPENLTFSRECVAPDVFNPAPVQYVIQVCIFQVCRSDSNAPAPATATATAPAPAPAEPEPEPDIEPESIIVPLYLKEAESGPTTRKVSSNRQTIFYRRDQYRKVIVTSISRIDENNKGNPQQVIKYLNLLLKFMVKVWNDLLIGSDKTHFKIDAVFVYYHVQKAKIDAKLKLCREAVDAAEAIEAAKAAKAEEMHNLYHDLHPTGTDSSHQNGPVECAHCVVGDHVCALLIGKQDLAFNHIGVDQEEGRHQREEEEQKRKGEEEERKRKSNQASANRLGTKPLDGIVKYDKKESDNSFAVTVELPDESSVFVVLHADHSSPLLSYPGAFRLNHFVSRNSIMDAAFLSKTIHWMKFPARLFALFEQLQAEEILELIMGGGFVHGVFDIPVKNSIGLVTTKKWVIRLGSELNPSVSLPVILYFEIADNDAVTRAIRSIVNAPIQNGISLCMKVFSSRIEGNSTNNQASKSSTGNQVCELEVNNFLGADDEQALTAHFKPYGNVVRVESNVNNSTETRTVVLQATEQEAKQAANALDGSFFGGHKLYVNYHGVNYCSYIDEKENLPPSYTPSSPVFLSLLQDVLVEKDNEVGYADLEHAARMASMF